MADFTNKSDTPPDDWRQRAGVLIGQQKWDDLIALSSSAILTLKTDAERATAHLFLGFAYDEKGEHDRAIVNYNKAIKLKPDYATAYNNRGYAYRRQGKDDPAFNDFNQAIKLNPNHVGAYKNRAYIYAKKGEDDKALADWEKALELAPKGTTMHAKIRADMKSVLWSHKQISDELKSARGFWLREGWHLMMQIFTVSLTVILLGALLVFYAIAFGVLAYRFGIIDYFPEPLAFLVHTKEATPDASKIFPWIPVVFLTSSPIIWAVRIANRAATRHFTMRENAYANKLMALLIYDTPEKERAEFVKKFFDHHSLRGSPRLVIDLENKPKTDDSVVWQLLNLVRRGGGKPGDNK